MKTKTISMTALAMLPAALFALTSCSSTSDSPPPVGSAVETYRKGVPGGVLVQTVKVTATVTAIDQAHRKLTLQGTDGKGFTAKVGREAVNFNQVRLGDQVTATLTQKMAVSLDAEAAPSGEGATATVARAPNAAQPGGPAAETIQATGTITAIDLEKREVTLQFVDGSTQTFSARRDTDMRRLKLGQREVLRVDEMVAIWVEKQQ